MDTPSETAPHYTEILESVTWGNTVKGNRRQICDENCPTDIGDICENNKCGVMFWDLRIATFEKVGHPFTTEASLTMAASNSGEVLMNVRLCGGEVWMKQIRKDNLVPTVRKNMLSK